MFLYFVWCSSNGNCVCLQQIRWMNDGKVSFKKCAEIKRNILKWNSRVMELITYVVDNKIDVYSFKSILQRCSLHDSAILVRNTLHMVSIAQKPQVKNFFFCHFSILKILICFTLYFFFCSLILCFILILWCSVHRLKYIFDKF